MIRAIARRGELGHLIVALLPAWFAWAASVAVIGWLTFEDTRSPAVVGVAFAIRMAPLVLAGVPMGSLSDRIGRARVLQLSSLLATLVFIGVAVAATAGRMPVALVLVAAALVGLADSGRMVSGNNLVFELAGGLGPTRAMAASTFVGALGQIAGGAAAGAVLSAVGAAAAAATVAAGYLLAAVLAGGLPAKLAAGARTSSFTESVRDGLAILRRIPAIGLLIGAACVVEMFAFSCVALDPTFAGQVFLVGPAGLGWILATRAAGRLAGSIGLVAVPSRRSVGRVLAGSVVLFGVALATYAVAPSLPFALPSVFVVGIASVVVDAIVLTAVQAGVAGESRGRAAGLWVLMVGLQPIGVLEVGFVAQLAGARWAQSVNGVIVVAFGVAMLLSAFGRRISEMRSQEI